MLTRRPVNIARSMAGFSLIEMMVALVVGLILIGSVIALATSNIQANAQNIAMTRLTQELRAVTDVITRDLKRARYQEKSMYVIGTGGTIPATLRTWRTVTVTNAISGTAVCDRCPSSECGSGGGCLPGSTATTDGDCIQYAYQNAKGDKTGAGTALTGPPAVTVGPNDARTISRDVVSGVGRVRIETGGDPSAPPACTSTTATVLSSPEVNITLLAFNFDSARDLILVTVEGSLTNDSTIKRRVTETVRLRQASI